MEQIADHDVFQSLHDCHRARRSARRLTRAFDEALLTTGLSATQLVVLAAIVAGQATSIARLAAVVGIERTTLTRLLRPLERAGLVTIDEEGLRRSRALSATALGRERMAVAVPIWRRAQQILLERLGREWPDAPCVLAELAL